MSDLFGTLAVLLTIFLFCVFFSALQVSREYEKERKKNAKKATRTAIHKVA
ncbi:hypothetical protein [Floricoccus penangensis]|uniref:hypothetical protein n=1 Tax=Floricoccus penangensis TaxID=1859475 RepID=UPI0013013EA1|nr:hypothetical protein [Floricoccus penangensis]